MKTIIEQAAKKLFDLGSEYDNISNTSSRLIFPTQEQPQKGKRKRVSEQELRQCFVEVAKSSDYMYSVETPTLHKYRKTGSKDISGNLDMCLYSIENKKIIRKVCIEFKAHNMNPSYSFDLYKATREPGNNLYYHLLESVNNGTLTTSSKKREGLLEKLQKDLRNLDTANIHSESLTIAVVCLSPRLLICQTLTKDSLINRSYNLIDLDYHIKRKQLKTIDSKNWSVLIQ